MRVMVMVKATATSEANVLPKMKDMQAMGEFNQKLAEAGVLVDGDGLRATSFGKRIRYQKGKATGVSDGPFGKPEDIVAGFWIWKVKSIDEAMEWMKLCPDPFNGEDSYVEVRPFFEAADFGEEFTAEMRAYEQRIRETVEKHAKSTT